MFKLNDPRRGYEATSNEVLLATREVHIAPVQELLTWMLDALIVLPEEWDELPAYERESIAGLSVPNLLLQKLVQRHLITPFQSQAIEHGSGAELILGHYRLLEKIGQGGMSTVYRAEHLQLRRQVAVKVMARSVEGNARMLHRFYAEARAVARLQHPNIVSCFDAGRAERRPPAGHPRDYFVMELIPGQDIYSLVREKGPISAQRACDLFRQVGDALAEAHRHGLVHRDLKPSNILVTPDWQAKLLDFGLARFPQGNVTEPGTLLGTVGYMAPEQARDPHGVDARADLFSLGATMYWALTGREPYPETGNTVQDLHRRFTTCPESVRRVRPEVPLEVSDLVARLMETDPDLRYPSARAVAATLSGLALWVPYSGPQAAAGGPKPVRTRVLVVDDDPSVRRLMIALLQDHYETVEAEDAETALLEVARTPPDLAVIDVQLPGVCGTDLITRLRAASQDPTRLKVLLVSGEIPAEALGGLAVAGANDFLPKPFSPAEFLSRVRTLLLRQSAGTAGQTMLVEGVRGLTQAGTMRRPHTTMPSPYAAAEALSYTISRLLSETNFVGERHWFRVVGYVRALAGAVRDEGEYIRLKDDTYTDLLAAIAPVYDIGLLAIPRSVVMKPDRLDSDERNVVQAHTTLGAAVMMAVAGKFAPEMPSLPLAAEVSRSHHERWDGSGYPDQLAGDEIPLSARVVAVAAVYEALRSRRPHRPPLSHSRAVKIMTTESGGHFDPALIMAFVAAAPRFEQIYDRPNLFSATPTTPDMELVTSSAQR